MQGLGGKGLDGWASSGAERNYQYISVLQTHPGFGPTVRGYILWHAQLKMEKEGEGCDATISGLVHRLGRL